MKITQIYWWKNKKKKREEKGQVKLVQDMTLRELRNQRTIWKNRQQKHRVEKKNLQNFIDGNSPPESETEANDLPENDQQNAQMEVPKEDGRKLSEKKKARQNSLKAQKEIHMYREMYMRTMKAANKYRKRYERLIKKNNIKSSLELTPKSKVNKMLKRKIYVMQK